MAKEATSSTPAAKPSVKTSTSAKPAPKRAVAANTEEAAPAPPPEAAVVTLKQLAAQFSDSHEIPAKQAQAMLDSVVGLTPLQNSSGGKERLGRISKMGDKYRRRLLVIGETSLVRRARSKPASVHPDLVSLLEAKAGTGGDGCDGD